MRRKYLKNGLYIISVLLLFASIILSSRKGDIDILFWLGLLVAAVAMMMEESDKKDKK